MRLIIRPVSLGELSEAFDCIRGQEEHRDTRERLIAMWQYTVERRQAVAAVIEDLDLTFQRRIVGFGIAVFAHPWFAEAVRCGQHAYIAKAVLDLWEMRRSPFLTEKEIARANAVGGLHALNLSSGMPADLLHNADARPIMNRNTELLQYAMRGFQLIEFLGEVYGETEACVTDGLGLRRRTDTSRSLDRAGAEIDPARTPIIVGIDRSEALAIPGTTLASVFDFAAPILFLSAGEQDVMIQALLGRTDEEIAEQLCVSFATIRKRWASVYDKVADTLPDLFVDQDDSRRSREKRRRVLAYLDTRWSELRPYACGASD